MNNLIIMEQTPINNNISLEQRLQEFYNSIDVVDETKKTYKKGINNFLKWCKDNDIKQVDKKVMLNYKQYLINTFETTTARTYLSGVRNLFNFLEELGIPNIMRNIKGVKVSKQFRKQPLTREQALKIQEDKQRNLITLKDYRDYAIYCLMLRNGLREIELNRANKKDLIQLNGRFVLKIQGKGRTDKDQLTVLEDGALIPLLTYLDKRGNDEYEPLFIGLSSNNYGTRLTTKSIRVVIKGMFNHNGYISSQLTTHSLRHTALTFALKGGATLQETKEIARHQDINTTLIYSHNIDRIDNAPEHYIEEYLKKGINDNGENNNNSQL